MSRNFKKFQEISRHFKKFQKNKKTQQKKTRNFDKFIEIFKK